MTAVAERRPKVERKPQAFDLDTAVAARREAAGEHFEFTFGGDRFSIPPPKEWDIEATDRLAAGEIAKALRLLMTDQYDKFAAHHPRIGDMETLMEALAAWQGMSLGE